MEHIGQFMNEKSKKKYRTALLIVFGSILFFQLALNILLPVCLSNNKLYGDGEKYDEWVKNPIRMEVEGLIKSGEIRDAYKYEQLNHNLGGILYDFSLIYSDFEPLHIQVAPLAPFIGDCYPLEYSGISPGNYGQYNAFRKKCGIPSLQEIAYVSFLHTISESEQSMNDVLKQFQEYYQSKGELLLSDSIDTNDSEGKSLIGQSLFLAALQTPAEKLDSFVFFLKDEAIAEPSVEANNGFSTDFHGLYTNLDTLRFFKSLMHFPAHKRKNFWFNWHNCSQFEGFFNNYVLQNADHSPGSCLVINENFSRNKSFDFYVKKLISNWPRVTGNNSVSCTLPFTVNVKGNNKFIYVINIFKEFYGKQVDTRILNTFLPIEKIQEDKKFVFEISPDLLPILLLIIILSAYFLFDHRFINGVFGLTKSFSLVTLTIGAECECRRLIGT
ncbi:MAG: hypothetical protein KKD31_14580 [Bacteroidetes bacterium]|nr:hypothetical protein [Bacteroidota bacterium]